MTKEYFCIYPSDISLSIWVSTTYTEYNDEPFNDSTDHIHQHKNTTIVSRYKLEDHITQYNAMSGRHCSMEQRHGQLQNHCCPDFMPLRCTWVGISQSIENIMDGKNYRPGSIAKDGNKKRNSETIQEEDITLCGTSL